MAAGRPVVAPIVPAERVDAAVTVLRTGGLVLVPTDTVYGIAAMPGDARAVAQAFRATGRTPDGTLPLLLANRLHLSRVAAAVPAAAQRLADAFWPGPLTLLLRRAPGLRGVDTGELVAVRVPAHQAICTLLEAAGGVLVVVSAGRARTPPQTAAEAAATLGRRVRLILDGGTPGGTPSCLVDCSQERPRLVREGAIPAARLARAAMVRFL